MMAAISLRIFFLIFPGSRAVVTNFRIETTLQEKSIQLNQYWLNGNLCRLKMLCATQFPWPRIPLPYPCALPGKYVYTIRLSFGTPCLNLVNFGNQYVGSSFSNVLQLCHYELDIILLVSPWHESKQVFK